MTVRLLLELDGEPVELVADLAKLRLHAGRGSERHVIGTAALEYLRRHRPAMLRRGDPSPRPSVRRRPVAEGTTLHRPGPYAPPGREGPTDTLFARPRFHWVRRVTSEVWHPADMVVIKLARPDRPAHAWVSTLCGERWGENDPIVTAVGLDRLPSRRCQRCGIPAWWPKHGQ